jgi:hypothetical protein
VPRFWTCYLGDHRGYDDDILSSTDQQGDFACYTVRSAVHGWTTVPRAMAGRTTASMYATWEKGFEKAATAAQLNAYADVLEAGLAYAKITWDEDWVRDGNHQERENAWTAFEKATDTFATRLNDEQRAEFDTSARSFLYESTLRDRKTTPPPELNPMDVSRWICWRSHELGWGSELFSAFESSGIISRDRIGNHRIERVGKKYQRIALGEAIARISDHLARDGGEGKIEAYMGTVDELSMLRDIDSSLLVQKTLETNWAHTPATWWAPTAPELRSMPVPALLAWLASPDEGFINGAENIEVTNPGDQRQWLVVSSFKHWGIPRHPPRPRPDMWSRTTCFLTKKGDGQQLVEELIAQDRGDHDILHEGRSCESFIGEHGWREVGSSAPRLRPSHWARITTACMTVNAEFRAETGTTDNSILETFHLDLPSAWLLQAIREISRRTGLARNTVKKYLRAGDDEPRYARRASSSKLDPYAEKLSTWLAMEATKTRKQRKRGLKALLTPTSFP